MLTLPEVYPGFAAGQFATSLFSRILGAAKPLLIGKRILLAATAGGCIARDGTIRGKVVDRPLGQRAGGMRFDRLPEQIRTALRTPTNNNRYVTRAALTHRPPARDFGTYAPSRRWRGSRSRTAVGMVGN